MFDLPNENALLLEAPGAGGADDFSWGYTAVSTLTYNRALWDVNLQPYLALSRDVLGKSPGPLAGFVEDRVKVAMGMTATYLEKWSADLSYIIYTGASHSNSSVDRDFVSVNLKRSF